MKIHGREISPTRPPYIVAEISGNHCGSLERALRLVRRAKRAGANAVKTQCYEADTLTLPLSKPDFVVQNGLWMGRTLYEIYDKSKTPFHWHKDLYKVARDEDITIFSSVFDFRGVDYLETLGCPAYKIASFEIVDIPLIEYAAKTGKPIIISTGLASDPEIIEAYDCANKINFGNVCMLHCTSDYPGTVAAADLGRIDHLRVMLDSALIGISDHTLGSTVPVAATVMGACIIEKHLKLADNDGHVSEDDKFSTAPIAFSMMAMDVRDIWLGMKPQKHTDKPSRQFRRSLYAVRDIKKGDLFTTSNIRSIRPGYGLPPKLLPKLLGTKAKRDWKMGEKLS